MKKIDDYRKLLNVTKDAGLKDLKTVYRNAMKAWHPDIIQNQPELLAQAEVKSQEIIEAYHFLVSIAPETQAENMPEYSNTINNATIVDYQFKGQVLKIDFSDGNSYEYYDVPRTLYVKLVNADTQNRFARRHIFTSFTYRNVSKMSTTPA